VRGPPADVDAFVTGRSSSDDGLGRPDRLAVEEAPQRIHGRPWGKANRRYSTFDQLEGQK